MVQDISLEYSLSILPWALVATLLNSEWPFLQFWQSICIKVFSALACGLEDICRFAIFLALIAVFVR